MMAAEIARRCEYFFQLWMKSDSVTYKYTDEDFNGCPESLEYLTWLLEEVPDDAHAIWERGQEVRRFKPTNPAE